MAPQLSYQLRKQIIALREAGHNVSQISQRTGITRKTIYFWLQRWEDAGSLEGFHRQLYKRATTVEQDAAMVAAHLENPLLSTRTTSSQYNTKEPEPAATATSATMRATTTLTKNYEKSTNFPHCDECTRPVDARELYRCVQCPLVVMCADCGRSNAHAYHCVLRMPSLQVYNKVEYLFELLTDVFHKKLSEEVDDKGNESEYDDKKEEMNQEVEISVCREDDSEDQKAIPGPSKKRKSSANTSLTSWRDVKFSREPPDEGRLTSHIKTEPDADPLQCPQLCNILQKRTDESEPKKRKTVPKIAPKKENATELNTDARKENIASQDQEELVEIKLELLDSDAAVVDTEKYASYGSHRVGDTDL